MLQATLFLGLWSGPPVQIFLILPASPGYTVISGQQNVPTGTTQGPIMSLLNSHLLIPHHWSCGKLHVLM